MFIKVPIPHLSPRTRRSPAPEVAAAEAPPAIVIPGGIESEEEQQLLEELNDWVQAIGLPRGQLSHELVHPGNGDTLAVLDLAWPDGLQVGLSEPVAVLLNEGPELVKIANQCGYRYFTEVERFKRYVEEYVVALARYVGTSL